MSLKWLWKTILGAGLAILISLALISAAAAQTGAPDTPVNECEDCHEIIQEHWQNSTHARAVSDPIFKKAWEEQGSPDECLSCHTTGFNPLTGTWETDGVSCTICHYPAPDEHPDRIMPTDISSQRCGDCHLDTYAQWQTSTHGQDDLVCVRCHNPHTTELKANNAQALCQSCHEYEGHFYAYTAHADEGIICTDCHVRVSQTKLGDGHGQRLHAFTVDLETCSECHGKQMHYPTAADMTTANNLEPEPERVVLPASVTPLETTPPSPSPYRYLGIASLIGLGFGIVLAPWAERKIRNRQEKYHEQQ